MTWEYIAGFFDGEGSLTRSGHGFRITIPQTNLRVLKKMKTFTRSGYVMRVVSRKRHWRQSWTYAISRQPDVLRFLRRVQSKLIVKRKVVQKALPVISLHVVRLSHRAKLARAQHARARKLRRQGLSYRAIGKTLGLDWGYVRRVVLSGSK